MDSQPMQYVAVFGASSPREGDEPYAFAREVGRALALRGYGVVNGGYGGTMEASARGAREAGAKTVGVTCEVWSSRPNAYLDEIRSTRRLQERLDVLLELASGGCVVLEGATGTLLELAMVWELTAKGFLTQRPIVCVADFWRPVIESMGRIRPGSMDCVQQASCADEIAACFPKRPKNS
jgi:hypothetical protein